MWIITACMLFIIVGLSPIVGFDVFWQFWSHLKKLRMSRQDIRDEFKNQEGDPQVKSRIRQQQRAMARRRMMADVPKADVVITNPTHFAVALRYEDGKRSAPEVLAWVYQLRRWQRQGGGMPKKSVDLPVPVALDFDPEKE